MRRLFFIKAITTFDDPTLAFSLKTVITKPAMRYTYHSEQWLPYPLDLVFAFFSNPENLPRLMPPWQKARIEEAALTAPPPTPNRSVRFQNVSAGVGSRITLSFKPFPYAPLRVPWEAEITEFVWNDHFCDRQLRGPFAYWHHCHSLRPETRTGISPPGTLLRDEIEYELPLGRLGDLANRIFITHQLRSTFAYRHTRTRELLLPLMRP
jgi:ligand-binding SRPBCC domain-containing protein